MSRSVDRRIGEQQDAVEGLSGVTHAEFVGLLKAGDELGRNTRFGRHLDVFAHLQEHVIPELARTRKNLNAVVIGPGLHTDPGLFPRDGAQEETVRRMWSWEYVHLANILEQERERNSGFDYTITVVDKDPLVAEAVRRQKTVIVGGRTTSDREYAESFMPEARSRALTEDGHTRLVRIPDEVRKRVRVVEGDLNDMQLPPSDLTLFLNVSTYIPRLDHKWAAGNIVDRLSDDGVLVTNASVFNENTRLLGLEREPRGFTEKTRVYRKTTSSQMQPD